MNFYQNFLLRPTAPLLFSPDDGSGSSPVETGSEVSGSDAGLVGDGVGTASTEEKPVQMSQSEFDSLISKRIGQARKGWEAEIQNAATQASESEQQKLLREAEEARSEGASATAAANKTLVQATATVQASALGAKPERVQALLKLTDLSEVEVKNGEPDAETVKKALTAALNSYPEFKLGSVPVGSSGGEVDNGGSPTPGKPANLQEAVAKQMVS